MTDRQLNFYKRISTLSRSNQVTPEEKKYLVIATNELDKGSDFKKQLLLYVERSKPLIKECLGLILIAFPLITSVLHLKSYRK